MHNTIKLVYKIFMKSGILVIKKRSVTNIKFSRIAIYCRFIKVLFNYQIFISLQKSSSDFKRKTYIYHYYESRLKSSYDDIISAVYDIFFLTNEI